MSGSWGEIPGARRGGERSLSPLIPWENRGNLGDEITKGAKGFTLEAKLWE